VTIGTVGDREPVELSGHAQAIRFVELPRRAARDRLKDVAHEQMGLEVVDLSRRPSGSGC